MSVYTLIQQHYVMSFRIQDISVRISTQKLAIQLRLFCSVFQSIQAKVRIEFYWASTFHILLNSSCHSTSYDALVKASLSKIILETWGSHSGDNEEYSGM